MLHAAHVEAVPAITVSWNSWLSAGRVTRDGWLSLFMAAVVIAGYSICYAVHCDAPRTAVLAAGETVLAAANREPNPAQRGIIPVAELPAPGHGTVIPADRQHLQ